MSRFSANASKAQQATSRARQIEKIKMEDIKPSSRANPFLRFELGRGEKLHRLALEEAACGKGYDGGALFRALNLMVEVGERVAIIGPNGIGKTTLLRTLVGDSRRTAARSNGRKRPASAISPRTTPPTLPTTCRCSTG